jgi:hypothetical protein
MKNGKIWVDDGVSVFIIIIFVCESLLQVVKMMVFVFLAQCIDF